jgi:outer membrane PBP1 activator LpoA protein
MQPTPTTANERARPPAAGRTAWLACAFAVATAALGGCATPAEPPVAGPEPAAQVPAAPRTPPASPRPTRTPSGTVAMNTTPAPPAPTPAPAARTIALVLPLTGRMAAAGTALRDGFLAAWFRADAQARPELRVYDTGPGATDAYRRAVADGAGVVVGPLAKEDVQAVARIGERTVPTLALNALPDGEPVPPRFFQFALAPEDEARQVAARLVAEGRRVGVALVPAGEWGARVYGAFQAALEAGGGAVVAKQNFGPQTMDYSDLITALLGFDDSKRRHQQLVATLGMPLEFTPRRRDDVQFVFVAGQPTQGRLIRPQLKFHYAGDLPVYATSDVFDPNPSANEDLEGVSFPDAPWMISDDAAVAAVRDEVQVLGAQNVRRRGRLYAMGYDAFGLAGQVAGFTAPAPLDGLSGRLTLGQDGRVQRTLAWATIGPDGQPRAIVATEQASPVNAGD